MPTNRKVVAVPEIDRRVSAADSEDTRTVSEPMSRDTDAASAVASTADVSREMAAELLDVGAVYAECWPEGEGEGKPTRWRRIADRKIVAKGAPHPRHRPASSSSPSRDHL